MQEYYKHSYTSCSYYKGEPFLSKRANVHKVAQSLVSTHLIDNTKAAHINF